VHGGALLFLGGKVYKGMFFMKKSFQRVIATLNLFQGKQSLTIFMFAAIFALSACDDSSSAGGDDNNVILSSDSREESSDSRSNDKDEAISSSGKVTDKVSDSMSSDSKSNDPAEVTDKSSDSKDCPSSAGTSTESSNSNSSGNDAMSSNSSAKSSSSSVIVTNSSSSRNENSSSSETTLSCSSELSEASSSSESLSAGSIYDATANTLTDLRDGKTYKTVTIGRQIWMAENLNYAYTDVFYKRDNYTSDSTSWCYDNDPANCAKYGRLYTWAAAMDSLGKWSKNGKKCGYIASCSPTYPVRGICPKGWHLPSKQEFGTLITAVGDSSTNGTVLKSTDGWSNHGNGTDAFGFSALPAGARSDGHYVRRGSYAYFWSSNDTKGISHDAYRMYLYCGEDIAGLIYDNKNHGASVRCVKDSN